MKYQIWDETNESGTYLYVWKVTGDNSRCCIKAIGYVEDKEHDNQKNRQEALGEALQFIEIQKKTEYKKEMIFEL